MIRSIFKLQAYEEYQQTLHIVPETGRELHELLDRFVLFDLAMADMSLLSLSLFILSFVLHLFLSSDRDCPPTCQNICGEAGRQLFYQDYYLTVTVDSSAVHLSL